MTAADINRFLVVCSLMPDLYCPGYSSAETLSKEANLMRTAARYRVDALKIASRVNAELSAKRRPAGDKPYPASSRRKHHPGKTK
jgi:hypothetical protein